ncbi:hypothetical protein PTD2_18270 [Pseudoalteromonas tunicata D2]|uniref:Uncharacterized protein n=1 Tax=Pseudoalteromonas tunicata D2 TaxID=87626 RepID=A4CBQ7_9GAMM|nr:hypothetical protein PTD2_18270 [Pseudoalteromonas tunicata D2]
MHNKFSAKVQYAYFWLFKMSLHPAKFKLDQQKPSADLVCRGLNSKFVTVIFH